MTRKEIREALEHEENLQEAPMRAATRSLLADVLFEADVDWGSIGISAAVMGVWAERNTERGA